MVSVRAPRCFFLPGSRKAQSEPDDIQHTTHTPDIPITNKSCQTDRHTDTHSVSQSVRHHGHQDTALRPDILPHAPNEPRVRVLEADRLPTHVLYPRRSFARELGIASVLCRGSIIPTT